MRFDGFGFSASKVRLRPAAPHRLIPVTDFGPNPGDLDMFFHAPPRLAPGAALVVILHGCGQSAKSFAHGTGWTALADAQGFAVLAPGQRSANNRKTCFNWFQPGDHLRGHGEGASIVAMIAHAVTRWKLDPARVFVTGLSAGGAMAASLLATYPELFAGGAIIAGLPHGAASNVFEALASMRQAPEKTGQAWGDAARAASGHQGPWPVLSVWHGDADDTVDAGNGKALVAQWRALHGTSGRPRRQTARGRQSLTWSNADGQPVVEYHRLAGLNHGVPIDSGDLGEAGPLMLEAGISSTRRIAQFWGLVPRPITVSLPAVTELLSQTDLVLGDEPELFESPEVSGEPLHTPFTRLHRWLQRAREIAGLD